MKYVSQGPTGTFDLTKYEDYLERQRAALCARISGADLLTIDRFVPKGPGSFHDARFESLLTTTSPSSQGGEGTQEVRAELRLMGPYFDRIFSLHYEGVASCTLQTPAPEDDLLMHEIRLEQDLLVHEYFFDNGKTISISCRELRFVETLQTGPAEKPD